MHSRPTAGAPGSESFSAGSGSRVARWLQARWKWLAVALALGLCAWAYTSWDNQRFLEYLSGQETRLRDFQQEHTVAICVIAFLIYAGVTSLPIPAATVLTLVYGWLFGFGVALVIVSFASTTGATINFLLSRYLLRDMILERLGDRLTAFNEALQREGAFYLFTLRLIPAVPFVVINLVMGLTPLGVWTYWWVSQVGMLAGTAVYVYAGTQLPTLEVLSSRGLDGVLTPGIIAAFVILGLFPIVTKKLLARFRPSGQKATA